MRSQEAIDEAARLLPKREGIPDPRREAMWLLAHAWGVDELSIRLDPDRQVPDTTLERFQRWVERRADGEPAHHLTGTCPFWKREFLVTPMVLVPRPETELLIATTLELPVSGTSRVLDVGTGSGCIAITLSAERPLWQVSAVDRSFAALEVAQANARRHGALVSFFRGDLSDAVSGPFDLVLANLPYIPTAQLSDLPVEVRHDPRSALDGGPGGLKLIGRLLSDLRRILRVCGGAVLEIGENQAAAVAAIAADKGLVVARTIPDVGGCDRVLVLQPCG